MAQHQQEWEELGRNIQEIVDRAVNSHDYQKLNQTIRQTVDRAVDLGTGAVRRAVDSASQKQTVTVHPVQKPPVVQKKNLSMLYANPGSTYTAGVLKIVGGGILTALTLSGTIASFILNVMFGFTAGAAGALLPLAGFAGATGLIVSGSRTLSRIRRFKTYRKILGDKTYCTIEKLARSVGKSVKFVRKELQNMIDRGLFLEGHFDKEQTQLITSNETYRYFEQSRLQLEQRRQQEKLALEQEKANPLPAGVQEVLARGNAFIAEIRRCNDAIPGEEISAKIDRMELIVRRIFQRAKSNPEIIPDLKKMMDYYLPMTVKLLNAYAEMDAQPVQGETIRASKKEIEGTLDTLNLAFEKLLDELFADTALDISSDISVLNTLLAQEGLTGDDFHRQNNRT